MLKSFWNNLVSSEPDHPAARAATALDRAKLKMLVEHFPIGKKLRYYPEFQRDINFSTIIVAYCVNDQYLYSRDAIEVEPDGAPAAFLAGEGRVRLPLGKVRKLQLVVPDTTDMERTLDYYRRADIGRGGQFSRGNAITLLSDTGERGIPSVDTQVEKRLRMQSGPYADTGLILLSPEFDTLEIKDQRQQQRLLTKVPVELYLKEDEPPFRCILGDFSEKSARLQTLGPQDKMPAIGPNAAVTLVFSLGDPPRSYMIHGVVFRRADDACVIRLRKLYKDGEFVNFKLMDMLEIKTGLLNYGY